MEKGGDGFSDSFAWRRGNEGMDCEVFEENATGSRILFSSEKMKVKWILEKLRRKCVTRKSSTSTCRFGGRGG